MSAVWNMGQNSPTSQDIWGDLPEADLNNFLVALGFNSGVDPRYALYQILGRLYEINRSLETKPTTYTIVRTVQNVDTTSQSYSFAITFGLAIAPTRILDEPVQR